MQHKTKGIVLRCVKYGETSLIVSIFTEKLGLHSYMLKGIRGSQRKQQKAGLFQVGSILDLVVEHKQEGHLHFIKEYQTHYFYQHLQEEMHKNSILIFSVEVLQKLLPQGETLEELYYFVSDYLKHIDQEPNQHIANYPLYFLIVCGRQLGYSLSGDYSSDTPFLDYENGHFCKQPQHSDLILDETSCKVIGELRFCDNLASLKDFALSANQRGNMIDWYILFLKQHTQHFGNIRSLEILKVILH